MSENTPDSPGGEAVELDREELLPMRAVASMTGLKPVTLRAWERRYGLVKPRRAAGGHRLYSRAEVELLRRVVTLLEGGLSIGHVAGLVAADAVDGNAAARRDRGLCTLLGRHQGRA